MRRGTSAAAAVLLACASGAAGAEQPVPPHTDTEFCARAQQLIAGTTRVPRNVVHTDFEAFKESKAAIRPLETHQFVLADEPSGLPLRISCKMKTPDQLNIEYGAGAAAAAPKSCADIQRRTVASVYASLAPAERSRALPRERIVLDADEVTWMGTSWLRPYRFVYEGEGGRLHLAAKSLHIDWTNRAFAWAPDSVRGVYYCHLIAPEYLRSIVLREVRVVG